MHHLMNCLFLMSRSPINYAIDSPIQGYSNIMSKKNIKGAQQSKNGRDDIVQLSNLRVAQTVGVLLPIHISLEQQNRPLLQGYLRAKLINKKVTLSQSFVALFKGKQASFSIVDINGFTAKPTESTNQNIEKEINRDSLSYIVANATQIKLITANKSQKESQKLKQKSHFYGYRQEVNDLKQSILNSLFQREDLIKNGLGPIKGILLSGFSGAGKSALLRQMRRWFAVEQHKVYWRGISSVEMLSRVVGGAEQFIRGIFNELKQNKPAVLTIEDVHLLFGVKEVSAHQTVLATLLSELDSIDRQEIVVVATYNSDRELAKSIRSSGKFQKDITLSLPNHNTRLQILQKMTQRLQLNTEVELQSLRKINLRLNGFSVGEMKQILRQAYSVWGVELKAEGLEEVVKRYRPAQIKELIVEVPQVTWNQIGGYQAVKKQIRKVVELPLQHADKFIKFGIQPSKGILLYGPPGCSKTMMAKAIATESKLNFIGIKGPQLFSKYVGDSQRAIRNIFKRARACSPCVVFFDQIDALATQRSANTEVSDRVLCQLLNEMDGIEGLKEVAIVAATNRPQILDKALMRPGRFDYLIYVSPPDVKARTEIFQLYLKKSVNVEDAASLSEAMAKKTQNYTGAEISLICREAVVMALEEDINCDKITACHLQGALKKIKNRLTWQVVSKYEQFSLTLKE